MPFSLNFRVEDRGGVMVLITRGARDGEETVRPASSAEVELWNALSRRFAAPARESYIRVNEQDLVTTLMERDHLRRENHNLQKRVKDLEQKLSHGHEDGPHEAADERGAEGREPPS